jgi:hypothetical protein
MENRLISIEIIMLLVIGCFTWAPNILIENTSADGWEHQKIDSKGSDTSIAIDSNGDLHISYYISTNKDLKYARWDGSSWLNETVDLTGDVGRYSSLALDGNDHPHISYYDETNKDLKYARWTGNYWNIETPDSAGNVGEYTSIAIDEKGYAHISYYEEYQECNLKYAKWNGINWSIEVVDGPWYIDGYTSIALDESSYPHISYYDRINDNLKYAKWNGSDWDIEVVDNSNDVGEFSSISLDSNDNPHIGYYDRHNTALKYAKWNGSGWNVETVSDYCEGGISLTLDDYDSPYISHSSAGPIKHTWWNGSGWEVNIVTPGITGYSSSITLDGLGWAHISYCTQSGVYYAKGLIDITKNSPPNKPKIPSGSTMLEKGFRYVYSTSTIDPDGHYLRYTFDWGDGTTSNSSKRKSGSEHYDSHLWNRIGTFYIRVMATDTLGKTSNWSFPLKVTVIDSDPYSTYYILHDLYYNSIMLNVTTTVKSLNWHANEIGQGSITVSVIWGDFSESNNEKIVINRAYIILYTNYNYTTYRYDTSEEIFSINLDDEIQNIDDEFRYEFEIGIDEISNKTGLVGFIEITTIDNWGREISHEDVFYLENPPPTIDISVSRSEDLMARVSNLWWLIFLIIIVALISIAVLVGVIKRKSNQQS